MTHYWIPCFLLKIEVSSDFWLLRKCWLVGCLEGLKGTENEKLKEANQRRSKHGKNQRKDNEPLDLMSFHDKWIDGQIGGLGSVQEHVHGKPEQLAPLFEFRDLGSTTYDKFKDIVEKAENAVLNLHKHSGN